MSWVRKSYNRLIPKSGEEKLLKFIIEIDGEKLLGKKMEKLYYELWNLLRRLLFVYRVVGVNF